MLASDVSAEEDQPRMENLPDDVLCYIFIRLQARLVGQMRCVSKPLNALLSQPYFIKSHLNHSIRNNYKSFILGRARFQNKLFCWPHGPEGIQLPANAPSEDAECFINGSINGLVCFSSYDNRSGDGFIHIWNPSLSAFLTLSPGSNIHSAGFHFIVRFGYDPKTDDYKVVNLNFSKQDNTYTSYGGIFYCKKWLQVEVYSMRQGCWHSITQRFPSHVCRIHYQNYPCVDGLDGNVYWLGDLGGERKLQTIVVFDLGAETFNEIALPNCIAYDNENPLAVLSGNLCLYSRDREGQSEVWKMDKYGVADSWVKSYMFPQNCGIVRPSGFTLSNDLLMTCYLHSIAWYNLNTAEVKYIENKEPFHGPESLWYIDSLVWVAPPKRIMGSKDGVHCNLFKRWIKDFLKSFKVKCIGWQHVIGSFTNK
uniref:F-box/kelch-repeat protein At3g06240-like n=1 Tax=Erigeron canadensis TaxID=72917 RepID=UPI001CB8A8AF|nr:F-box/kelch-repeat protein At3g06240-like [Erigeron canadensis]